MQRITVTASHRAVVVDDDAERRDRLCAMVNAAGMDVVAVSKHGVALGDLLTAGTPGVVFVSMEEPFARAFQTMAYVSVALPDSEIIAYSSSGSVAAFQHAIRAGARHLLQVPLQESDVRRAVARITERAGAQFPSRREARGDVVSVVGQKGGIGKTTVAVNLAATLAREVKSSVLLIDFDSLFGDVALSLDLVPVYTTSRAAADASRLDFETFRTTLTSHESGAYVLGAAPGPEDWVTVRSEELEALVSFAAGMFDCVIIDTPGARNDAVAASLAVADLALIVTSLELASARNTVLLLDALRAEGYPEEKTLVVANHVSPATGFEPVDLAPLLARQSVWEVPHDPAMRGAMQAGKPLAASSPRSPASLSLPALAHRIAIEPERVDRRRAVRGERRPLGDELRLRLESALSHLRPEGEPGRPVTGMVVAFCASRVLDSQVYHVPGCHRERRILPENRSEVPLERVPRELRPCRVCRPPIAA